ncbi:MAG: hypothetical protein JKY53_03125 [Flavobacteriales bacterium]|nr:hypothetical protein [Flavobacteriales bacterium]
MMASFLFFSCKKSNQYSQWDADELVPLIKTSVNIYNLANYDELQVDSTGALKLVFNNSLFNLNLDSLVTIPDTALSEKIENLIFVGFIPGVSVSLAQDNETKLSIDNAELVEATIKSGTINVSIKSTFTQPTIVSYELTSATKNGNPLLISELIPAGSLSSPAIVTASYNIVNYNFDFRGLSGTSYNTLVAQISAMVAPSADTLTTQPTDYIEINYTFSDVKPSYARGYFGSELYSNSGSEGFEFLANIAGGSIDIETVDVNFELKNSVGVDLQAQINSISMQNTQTNNSTTLTSAALNNTINIDKAIETGVSTPPVIASTYFINLSNNSNIDELFEILPNQISYNFDLQLNPFGHVSSHNDFIYENNGIEILLNLEMPISIALNEFTLSDTVEFNMGKKTIDDRYLIIDGFIHLYADNWYPFSATSQLYLLDESYTIIDSILMENAIIEAGVLENDIVTEASRSKISGAINPTKIEALYNAQYLKVNFTLSTEDYPKLVTIYDHYKIDMTLVGDFNYVIDPNK